MIMQVFSVLDKAVHAFLPPFFARTKGEALRSFAEAVNDTKHQFYRHSSDYSLYHLGEFDDASALFSVRDPVIVVTALQALVDDPFTKETQVPSGSSNGSRLPM